MHAAKRVLVPIATATEDMELSIIVDVLRRAKLEVTVASVDDSLTCRLARGLVVTADVLIKDVAPGGWDMIALPGGMPGALNLAASAPLTKLLTAQRAESKFVSAICASPAVVLQAHGLLAGVSAATAYPSFQGKLEAATLKAAHNRRVVVSDRVITSLGPGSAIEFSLQCVASLLGVPSARAVEKDLCLPSEAVLV